MPAWLTTIPPPPEKIDDLEALRDEDRFRFANILDAWVEVDEKGKIKDFGYSGGAHDGQHHREDGARCADL